MLLKKTLKYFFIFLIALSLTMVLTRHYFRPQLSLLVNMIINQVAADGISADTPEIKLNEKPSPLISLNKYEVKIPPADSKSAKIVNSLFPGSPRITADRLKDFPPDFIENLWKSNSSLNKTLSDMAGFSEITGESEIKIPETVAMKDSTDSVYFDIADKFRIIGLMCRAALEKKDYVFMIDAELASIAAARYLPICSSDGIPNLFLQSFAFDVLAVMNENAFNLYINNDDIIKNDLSRAMLKKALDSRMRYLSSIIKLPLLVKCDDIYRKAFMKKYKETYLWLTSFVDLISGGPPYSDLDEFINGINLEPEISYSQLYSRFKDFNGKYYLRASSGLISHPFRKVATKYNEKIPVYFGVQQTNLRIVTLYGLARIYNFENNRWPDTNDEGNFIKGAACCGVDPITSRPFKTTFENNKFVISADVDNWPEDFKIEGREMIKKWRPGISAP